MKALVFDGEVSLKEVAKPQPRPNEALVKVSLAGVCRTDAEIARGYMAFCGILGHEFVGVVESSPLADQVGTRVVGEINAGCGSCSYCANDLARHCPSRTVLGILGRDGALAEFVALPVSNLIPVPEILSDEQAVFAEPLAAAVEILEQVMVRPGDEALVIGDGKLGLLVSMVLRLTGCDVTLVGKHPAKMAIFEKVGGRALHLDVLNQADHRFDAVVEASGSSSGWDLAVARVKPRGTLVLKSTYHGSMDFNAAPLVINEVTVVGSRCGRLAPALRLMSLGLVDPRPLISAVVPLDRGEEAFRMSPQAGVLKVLVRMV